MKVKARRRKLPVTSNSKLLPDGNASANPRSSARVIRHFHVLLKRKAQLERALLKPRSSTSRCTVRELDAEVQRKQLELEKVKHEVEQLGGLEAYQRMSTIGQGKDRGGGSERVFIEWLRELNVRGELLSRGQGKGKGKRKLRLLEVGALKPDNYASCSAWMNVLPIDLRSTHTGIIEQDLLQMDLKENREAWDAISLSLVVNFVPEPKDRGRMLHLAHELLREAGLLFLALPLPCVSNSRYLTFEHLAQLMAHVGFQLVRERWKEGGKMAYWLFEKSEKSLESGSIGKGTRFDKKIVLREGKRNNFCILL